MPLGNLRQLANNNTRVVNPDVSATLFVSTGFTVGPSHRQVPSYDQVPVVAQVQPLESGEIKMLDALNIQGASKAVYINGSALAIDRIKHIGGDLLVFPDGTLPEGDNWLIVASLEQWGNTWCKVAISLQDTPPGS